MFTRNYFFHKLNMFEMKRILIFLALFIICDGLIAQRSQFKIFTIAFYNVENLFDIEDDSLTLDEDFTPQGINKYTAEIYQQKIQNISRVISEIGQEETHGPPVIVGLSEIENEKVLQDLIISEPLKKFNYSFIHFDSPDVRGIDVALLYRENLFFPLEHSNHELKIWDESGHRIYSRDILVVSGILENEEIVIMVNHWPSRRAGEEASESKRIKAAYVLRNLVNEILAEKPNSKIVLMGDFNDNPVDESIKFGLQSEGNKEETDSLEFYNPMEKMFKFGLNTLAHRDGLHLFDQILVSPGLLQQRQNEMELKFFKAGIYNPPYLTLQQGKYQGYPFRSFSNQQFTNGFSDHYPVYCFLIKKIKNYP